MARSRLGGRSTPLRGKLGNKIYRQRRLANGQLVDTSYAVPVSRVNPNSDAQASARMIMGQIERMYHVLPDIIKDAYVSVERGPLSFQQFAKLNYPLLVDDLHNHFNSDSVFDWRSKFDVSAPAGPWILTEGNLSSLNYSSLRFYNTTRNGVDVIVQNDDDQLTVGELLQFMNLKRGDRIIFLLYRKDSPLLPPYIFQVYFRVSDNIDLDLLVADCYEDDIIIPDDDSVSGSVMITHNHQFAIWWEDANADTPYLCSCFAPLIIRFKGDRQLFSTATFTWGHDTTTDYYMKNCPADVFNSWKDL